MPIEIAMIYSAVSAILSIAFEIKQNADIAEGLRTFLRQSREIAEQIVMAAQAAIIQEMIENQFEALQTTISALTQEVEAIANPNQGEAVLFLPSIITNAFVGVSQAGSAVSEVVENEPYLREVEALHVSTVALAVDLYAIVVASTARLEELVEDLDLEEMRKSVRDTIMDKVGEVAMAHLRKRSDRRFQITSRPLGERRDGGPRMPVYGYTFDGKFYYSVDDEGHPGQDNSRIIARVREKMVKHQIRAYPKFIGVNEISRMMKRVSRGG